jgi:hypothetical protein
LKKAIAVAGIVMMRRRRRRRGIGWKLTGNFKNIFYQLLNSLITFGIGQKLYATEVASEKNGMFEFNTSRHFEWVIRISGNNF